MTPSPRLVDFVAAWEGFRSDAYLDAVGVPTLGFGFTQGVQMGDTITLDDAKARLADTLADYARELAAYMVRDPSQQQADALLSLAYNCGVKAIGNSGVMQRFNGGNDEGACERWLWWDKAGGRSLPGLHRRRVAEVAIYRDGDYSQTP